MENEHESIDISVKPHIEVNKRPHISVTKRESGMHQDEVDVIKIPKTLAEVDDIQGSGEQMQKRSRLRKIVEYPLLSACEQLYDKNIQTSMSSANKRQIRQDHVMPGFILIVWSSLSKENKSITREIMNYAPEWQPRDSNIIKIEIPIEVSDDVKAIQQRANNIASKFKKQPMDWAGITPEELKKEIGIKENEELTADFTEGYIFDDESGKYFKNEEQYRKYREMI